GRRSLNAEINVTPFVDVMLVLLIVFMITAPLLTKGVDVALPDAQAESLPANNEEPLQITIDAEGQIYLQQTEIELEELAPKLEAITGVGFDDRIFVRGDEGAAYGRVAEVLGEIVSANYRNVSLVTDPKPRDG
ncbi:MAG: biopolymer transporter ExbD, partial [Pseudomonadota bacterium]